jgi:hypothetical protein
MGARQAAQRFEDVSVIVERTLKISWKAPIESCWLHSPI